MDISQPSSHSAGFTPAQVYQPEQPQQATVITQPTTSPNSVAIGSRPTRITCPCCHVEILTSVTYKTHMRTHCWASICWPCACIPYFMDSCKSANHYCPNCDAFIGTIEPKI